MEFSQVVGRCRSTRFFELDRPLPVRHAYGGRLALPSTGGQRGPGRGAGAYQTRQEAREAPVRLFGALWGAVGLKRHASQS